MHLEEFNRQSPEKVRNDLFKCCGSNSWIDMLMEKFPFDSLDDLKISSDRIWFNCTKNDWLEAFSHHPKIGDTQGVAGKHNDTLEWARQEQSAVKDARQIILDDLTKANKLYENKFGFIFIVCATGKSAEEMLNMLNERLKNEPEKELHIAVNEQNKITHLRIDKLFS